MTGDEAKGVRELLGLDPFAFAASLGVHVSSVYRWEQSKKKAAKLDSLHLTILERLKAEIRTEKVGRDLGERVRRALLSGAGTLAALHTLITPLVASETP